MENAVGIRAGGGRERMNGHTLLDNRSMGQHKRKATRNHSDSHTGSPGSR